MPRERVDRLVQLLAEVGAGFAVLSSPDNVCYATGHAVPIETGPTPFAGGPTLAFVTREGATGLLRPRHVPSLLAQVDHEIAFDGFTGMERVHYLDAYLDAVREMSRILGLAGSIAVDPTHPAVLDKVWSQEKIYVHRELVEVRSTKTSDEIALLVAAAEIAAVGQRAARSRAVPGLTELELFSYVRSAMESAAGCRLPVTADLLTGMDRTTAQGGWPTDRRLITGDSVLVDLGPRVAGYWADSCGSFVIGEAGNAYKRMFDSVREALELAETVLVPGRRACDIDAEIRRFLKSRGYGYGHHSGHGIGAAVHEFPRLLPSEEAVIQPGMVLMIEPAAYHPLIGGIRLEHMFLVTATGARKIEPFELGACKPIG